MNEELKQSLDIDYMELLYEDDTVSIIELLIMHEGLNRNRCDIPHEVIVNALPSLANKPIWGIPNKTYLKDYSDDFIEHARNLEQQKNIMIFGIVPESGVKNAQFVEKDDKTYLKVQAILFKKYSPLAMNILKQRNGNCKISVEIFAKGDTIDGILYIKDLRFMAITCLGEAIKEGIEGSEMNIVRFSLNEAIKESNEKYLNFSQEKTYEIPKKMKDNAQKGLDMRKEYGRGGTSMAIKIAKYITVNETATLEKVKKISEYFPRHEKDNVQSEVPTNGFIAWNLYGGNEGQEWSKDIIKNIDTNDDDKNTIKNKMASDIASENLVVDIDNSKEIKNKEGNLMEENKKIEFSLNSTQIFEIFSNATGNIKYKNGDYECCKYWTQSYDENFVYICDCEENKTYKMPYTLQDNIATIDFENKVVVIGGGYTEVGADGAAEIAEEVGENIAVIINAEATEVANAEVVVNAEAEKDVEIDNSNKEMEAKYAELETKYSEIENKLKTAEEEIVKNSAIIATYARQDEEVKMNSMLKQFSHCFAEDEVKTMSEKIKESKLVDFEEIVNSKIKEFALNSKVPDDNESTIKNSYGVSISNFGTNAHYDYQHNDNATISMAEKYGVKIKSK